METKANIIKIIVTWSKINFNWDTKVIIFSSLFNCIILFQLIAKTALLFYFLFIYLLIYISVSYQDNI